MTVGGTALAQQHDVAAITRAPGIVAAGPAPHPLPTMRGRVPCDEQSATNSQLVRLLAQRRDPLIRVVRLADALLAATPNAV